MFVPSETPSTATSLEEVVFDSVLEGVLEDKEGGDPAKGESEIGENKMLFNLSVALRPLEILSRDSVSLVGVLGAVSLEERVVVGISSFLREDFRISSKTPS